MKYVLIVIAFLTLVIGGCDGYFAEKPIIPTPIALTTPTPIRMELPEGWKIQRNGKNEYRLIKPNGNILTWWGSKGSSEYDSIQNAINSAWEYTQRQIDSELKSKWHDIELK